MKIRIVGKFFDNHSLAIVNRNLAMGFHKIGHEVSIIAFDRPDQKYKVNQDTVNFLAEKIESELLNVDVEIRHTYPPMWKKSNCDRIFYIQPWEYNRAPLEWVLRFEHTAGLIVPSAWTRRVYVESGIPENKVHIVPNGYNPTIYHNIARTSKELKFLYVGSSQKRKGLDIVLSAYIETFKQLPNVSLTIRDNTTIYGGDILSDILKINYHQGTKIHYLNEEYSEEDMANLYRSCDYLVHTFRGEGFGMHILEAAICGCIPIVTSGGPPDEFINGIFINSQIRIADLVNEMQAIKPGDSLSLMGMHGTVLESDKNHLAHIFKSIYNKTPYNKPTPIIKEAFTWDEIAREYIKIIA